MSRGRTNRPYPSEYRAEVVRLVREGGRTRRQVAMELGCSEEAIRTWLKQTDLDAGRRTDGLTSHERAEPAALRKENRVLRMERDLLKKRTWRLAAPPRGMKMGPRRSV